MAVIDMGNCQGCQRTSTLILNLGEGSQLLVLTEKCPVGGPLLQFSFRSLYVSNFSETTCRFSFILGTSKRPTIPLSLVLIGDMQVEFCHVPTTLVPANISTQSIGCMTLRCYIPSSFGLSLVLHSWSPLHFDYSSQLRRRPGRLYQKTRIQLHQARIIEPGEAFKVQ